MMDDAVRTHDAEAQYAKQYHKGGMYESPSCMPGTVVEIAKVSSTATPETCAVNSRMSSTAAAVREQTNINHMIPEK